MLENVTRHLEAGMSRIEAALKGAREVGFTVVSMSVSLIAVFIPILLMSGIVGRLFREFAVTLAITILISGVVSLTLVPMLASRFLHGESHYQRRPGLVVRAFERGFEATLRGYTRTLDLALRWRKSMLALTLATFALTAWLFVVIPKGFFPEEDIGQISVSTEAAEA